MVLGPDHTKLSKRHGAVSVDEFREKGYLPEALLNYLALLSWSPGEGQELVPLADMAKRFSLSDVGHSASVFDEEKLAWVNRHYLKEARSRAPRPAFGALSRARGIRHGAAPSWRDGLSGRASCRSSTHRSIASTRCRNACGSSSSFLRPTALADGTIRAEVSEGPARQVIDALADELQTAPRLADRQAFRGVADRVKQKTGQKGRALFHPIRIALTGAGDGPELDLLVPAIERGAELDAVDGHRADRRRPRTRAAIRARSISRSLDQ